MMLAKSLQSAAGNAAGEANYIESVFQTHLYTGNGSTQTITNGIDLAGEGGLVWCKIRNTSDAHALFDTARGFPNYLVSNATIAQNGYGTPDSTDMVATSTGFSMNNISSASNSWNSSGNTFASWTFRKQPKFFDVVTWTGNSVAGRTVAHNLGSVPGCIIIKAIDGSLQNWAVYHRSLGATQFMYLNSTGAAFTSASYWNNTAPTATNFTLGTTSDVNFNGLQYVAYIFAHDAGGFGLSGTDNVISCGSYTGTSAQGNEQNLGYEPQWVMVKRVSSDGNWVIQDVMRGMPVSSDSEQLYANTSGATFTGDGIYPTATGFGFRAISSSFNASGSTYIYIAIRRGPMKVPESGTSVFLPVTRTGTGDSTINISTGFPPDVAFNHQRTVTSGEPRVMFGGKLLGGGRFETNSTNAYNDTGYPSVYDVVEWGQTSLTLGSNWVTSGRTYVNHILRRAPGFFDEVCYTGDGENGRSINHNLTVEPELIIAKPRSVSGDWIVYAKNNGVSQNAQAILNGDKSFGWYGGIFPSPYASSTTFQIASSASINESGQTYVAYLFATCPGVSKVFSYTGNGSSQTINCGFTGGARFVMIKRSNSTGDWYVWDTARGIVAGDDPHLSLNTTAAEVTTDDSVDTASTGFIVNQLAATNINVSSATYIGLAIA